MAENLDVVQVDTTTDAMMDVVHQATEATMATAQVLLLKQ